MSDETHLTALRTGLPTPTWRRLYPIPQTEEEWEAARKQAAQHRSSVGGSSGFGYGLAIGVALSGGF